MFPCRIVAIGLLLLLQGPALLVQEVAWVRMLVTYSQQRGLKRGVVETFDGKHPCPLCAKAASIRKQERQTPPAEQAPVARRLLLSWGEMQPCPVLRAPPSPEEHGSISRVPPWESSDLGRAADPPLLPPPESGQERSSLQSVG